MASKQQMAKEEQGYIAIPKVCMNCIQYESEIIEYRGEFGGVYRNEKNKRCGIGGFAVKKTATCNEFKLKQVGSD